MPRDNDPVWAEGADKRRPTSVGIGSTSPATRPDLADMGRHLSELGQNLGEVGRSGAHIGRIRRMSPQTWGIWANFGPEFGRDWADIGAVSAKFGPDPDFAEMWRGRSRPCFARARQKILRFRPGLPQHERHNEIDSGARAVQEMWCCTDRSGPLVRSRSAAQHAVCVGGGPESPPMSCAAAAGQRPRASSARHPRGSARIGRKRHAEGLRGRRTSRGGTVRRRR